MNNRQLNSCVFIAVISLFSMTFVACGGDEGSSTTETSGEQGTGNGGASEGDQSGGFDDFGAGGNTGSNGNSGGNGGNTGSNGNGGNTGSNGNSGGDGGTTDNNPQTEPLEVGAAYGSASDGRVLLISKSGRTFVYYNPSTGAFSEAELVSERLEGGAPLDRIGATGNISNGTFMVDVEGEVLSYYDRSQSDYSTPDTIDEILENAPFNRIGAALEFNGTNIAFFNQAGSSYAVYNSAEDTWSPIYSFATDFGGGGAPIASVGAAYRDDSGGYVLFSARGDAYCIYSGNGQFSDDFDLDELGDGTLSFN